MAMLRDNQLALPADLSMLFKVFLTLDGFCRQTNPDFEPIAEAKPCVRNAMIMRYTPQEVAKRGWHGLSGLIDLLTGGYLSTTAGV